MPSGKYVRDEEHRKLMSKVQIKRYRREKAQLEKYQKEKENKPKDNKFNGTTGRIGNLDKEELEDLLASVRYDILRSVKLLGQNFNVLMGHQKHRDEIEERLKELGFEDQ